MGLARLDVGLNAAAPEMGVGRVNRAAPSGVVASSTLESVGRNGAHRAMHGRVSLPASAALNELRDDADAIDLRQLQDFFWRRWKLVGMTMIAVMVLTLLALFTVTPRYTATAQVLLHPQQGKVFGAQDILPELSLESGNVDSQVTVIQSISLLRRVVEREKLTDDAEFGQPARPGLMHMLIGYFVGDENPPNAPEAKADAASAPSATLRSIRRLRSALDVQRVNRTYVLSISVTSEDPLRAERLADAVADAYVVDQLDSRYHSAKRASAWLAERMDGLRGQVHDAEEAVVAFRREHNIQSTSADSKVTIGEQQMSELNAKLATARADAAEKRAKYEQARDMQAERGDLQAIPNVVRSTVISQLRTQEAEVTRNEADLVSRYSDQHPLVINARAQRRDIEKSIAAEVARIISNLKNDYDVAKTGEESLQASLSLLTGQSGPDNNVGLRLRELERTATANRSLYEDFLSRAKLTAEESTLQEGEARLISPATKPGALVPEFQPRRNLVRRRRPADRRRRRGRARHAERRLHHLARSRGESRPAGARLGAAALRPGPRLRGQGARSVALSDRQAFVALRRGGARDPRRRADGRR